MPQEPFNIRGLLIDHNNLKQHHVPLLNNMVYSPGSHKPSTLLVVVPKKGGKVDYRIPNRKIRKDNDGAGDPVRRITHPS